MEVEFIKLDVQHKQEVLELFNYYIETTTAAYRAQLVNEDFFSHFCESGDTYCSFAIEAKDGSLVGFCLLEAYIPISTFSKAAEVMYFLHPKYTGKGIGALALNKLEVEAKKRGITRLIADISLENVGSIKFHESNGFVEFGKLANIGEKFGRTFGIIWMQKELSS
ncbi:N-acetyltransferase [Vagococcus sp. BWB3-3]|uniref:N-acetyltransferase n=1 Tax=Vagococcus allomyrinae TaxID=2794353 RepID=A0A940P933_9ENTE|nr:GNAT family N-acetyltransferase [Vagococcus allomyrinae]MBP1040202.1 N-acetyltransferase [Vagococcus allomyrinae]